ncbi:collagen alpha-1(III) chain-like [Sciurus carolinensis]|uniref:collagen alpha-1(III) chain-like n=1 Tax=Sciurus carolinensis TaxID=30640 RepID=UPI001FB52A5F|nr:collagen alpha-1(III) chain-like [Sciurus carolinensis]
MAVSRVQEETEACEAFHSIGMESKYIIVTSFSISATIQGCPHGGGHDEAAAGLTPTEFVSRQEARPCRTLSPPAELTARQAGRPGNRPLRQRRKWKRGEPSPRRREGRGIAQGAKLTRSGAWSRPGGGSVGGSQVPAGSVEGERAGAATDSAPRPPRQAWGRGGTREGAAAAFAGSLPAACPSGPPRGLSHRSPPGPALSSFSRGRVLRGDSAHSRVWSRLQCPVQGGVAAAASPGTRTPGERGCPASRRPAEWRATEEEPPPGRGRPRGEEPPPEWKCERKLVTSVSWIHCPKKTSNVCQEVSDSIAENSLEMYRKKVPSNTCAPGNPGICFTSEDALMIHFKT